MPTSALVTGLLETSLNKLVSLDPKGREKMVALTDCRLSVFLQSTPIQLSLFFSANHIDVLAELQDFDALISDLAPNHCVIKTSVDVLPLLRDSSQLTALIRQGKLAVEGELSVAQRVSELAQSIDIDWEEEFAKKTSDVFAHQTFSLAKQAVSHGAQALGRIQTMLANGALEEKPIAAHKLAVIHFNDQVATLRDDVARFEARLAKLEEN